MLKPNPRRFFKFTCGGKYSEKDLDRLCSKIDTTPGLGPEGDCWEWRGGLFTNGYGAIGIIIDGIKKTINAHRAAYEMATGILIPDGKVVMHKCDNRKCVKSYIHLQIGTYQDNMHDRDNKGRHVNCPGEKHGMAKLTWIQVKEIRRLYATGKYLQKLLSKQFNVTYQLISLIIKNKIWYDEGYNRTIFNKRDFIFTKNIADKIRELRATGEYTLKSLAELFSVSISTIYNITINKSWV